MSKPRAKLQPAATDLLLHSGPILALLGLAAVLQGFSPGVYYTTVQEDGLLEWLTFWAFALAAALVVSGPLVRGPGDDRPSLLTRVFYFFFALGCLLVAMEEISWGQRLLGYRPPERFLSDNFQQELNLHNLAGTGTRKLLLTALLVSFGVIYPLLCRLPGSAALLGRLGVPPLPLGFVPAFAGLTLLYLIYPWRYTGEWVELGAGLGFFQAALVYRGSPPTGRWAMAGSLLAVSLVSVFLQSGRQDPARSALAKVESRALAEDFAARRYRSRCGVHKRLYTFVKEYGGMPLAGTSYGRLPVSHPEEQARRDFFLDPWNLPYWVRHTCDRSRGESTLFVYSFGPNRRRDSDAQALRADDVGTEVTWRRER